MTLGTNQAPCTANSYPNKPCVSVTVCSPTGTNCQTVNDILLDTGSYGLRIFRSAFANDPSGWLTQINNGGGQPVAECAHFGDGSMEWGTVRMAGVVLANEPLVQLPMQFIDASFATYRSASVCGSPQTSPTQAGLNGILGVGMFVQDCGSVCATQPANNLYYACNGASCTGTTISLANQVQNPAALLPPDTATVGSPQDNNGLIVVLPSVSPSGAIGVQGYVVLGIGTRTNNTPGAVTAFAANASGNFTTISGGQTYNSFLDSGSNALYFPIPADSNLPDCTAYYSGIPAGWYCPLSGVNLSAVTQSDTGSSSTTVNFQVASAMLLYGSSNSVFSDLAGNQLGNVFDWGFPMFLGRNVYIGFAGRLSTLGSGMYWAY